MNVTMEKNGSVGGIITVSLEEKDYQEKVSKDLKTIGLFSSRQSSGRDSEKDVWETGSCRRS